MPDLIIYPYGKPVKVRWDNEAVPPTPEEVDGIIAHYKSVYPQGGSKQVATGRLPERTIGGQLPVQGQIGGLAPVQPFGPGASVPGFQQKEAYYGQQNQEPKPKEAYYGSQDMEPRRMSGYPGTPNYVSPQIRALQDRKDRLETLVKRLEDRGDNSANARKALAVIYDQLRKANTGLKPSPEGAIKVGGKIKQTPWVKVGGKVQGQNIHPEDAQSIIFQAYQGAKAMFSQAIQSPLDEAQTAVNVPADALAKIAKQKLPNGLFLRQDTSDYLDSLGFEGKKLKATLNNLDITQVPAFVAALTAEADKTQNTGLKATAKGFMDTFYKATVGQDPDAGAELLGMYDALIIQAGTAHGGVALKEAIGIRTPGGPTLNAPKETPKMPRGYNGEQKVLRQEEIAPGSKYTGQVKSKWLAEQSVKPKENPNFTPKELEGYTSPSNLSEAGVPLKTGENPAVAAKKAELDARRAARNAPKAETPEEKPGGEKQPWEMTREEFVTANPKFAEMERLFGPASGAEAAHAHTVASAIEKGHTVPKRVIDSLPDYAKNWDVISKGKKSEPWMSTWSDISRSGTSLGQRKWHKSAVESALKEGKPVPQEVLADYPDLAAKYGKEKPAVSTQGTTRKVVDPRSPAHDQGLSLLDFASNKDVANHWKALHNEYEKATLAHYDALDAGQKSEFPYAGEWAKKQGLSEKEAQAFDDYRGGFLAGQREADTVAAHQKVKDGLTQFEFSPKTKTGPISELDIKKIVEDFGTHENEHRIFRNDDVYSKADRLLHQFLSKAFEKDAKLSYSVDTLDDLLDPRIPEGRKYVDQFLSLAEDLGLRVRKDALGGKLPDAPSLPTPNTPKAPEAPQKPVQGAETENVRRVFHETRIGDDFKGGSGNDVLTKTSKSTAVVKESDNQRRIGTEVRVSPHQPVAVRFKATVTPEDSPIKLVRDLHKDLPTTKAQPKGKVNRRTGLTPEQEAYLSDALAKGAKDGGDFSIHVPGDGKFTIENPRQASTLHQAMTGKPLDGIEPLKTKAPYRDSEPRMSPQMRDDDIVRLKKTFGTLDAAASETDKYVEYLRSINASPSNIKVAEDTARIAYTALQDEKRISLAMKAPEPSILGSGKKTEYGNKYFAEYTDATGETRRTPAAKTKYQAEQDARIAAADARGEWLDARKRSSKLASVDAEIAAVKARRDARLKSTTTKGTKRSGHADFTKDDFNDALELAELYVKKVGYTFEQYAKEMVDYFGDGVKPHLKEIWDTHVPKAPEMPRVSVPKTEDVTGVAKQVTGRDPMKGVTREEMDQIGKDALLKDSNIVANAVEKTKTEGKVMDETELSASAVRLRQIANKESEIRGQIDTTKDPAELFRLNAETIKLETERESILMATDYSLNRGFHRMGIAAQLVHKPDFSLGMLKAKAKAAFLNTVEVIPKHVEMKLASYASSIDRLNAELDAAKKQIHDLINKGTFRRGTKENNVKRLRKFFGEDAGEYTPMASKNTRQRGAVYTIPSEERDAMAAMRSLAKQLADDGAKNLDDIVAGIRKEVGQNIPEETIYRMLSDKYRRYLLESDVARIDANRYLRDIQRGAEFKLRGPLEKSLSVASDIIGSTARSMQAGWDVSAPFIQGRKGLVANPVGWFKAWENQLKAYRHGDEVVTRRLTEMERHPMYSRFVAAGGDKLLRRPGGHFSAQEETFANNFMRLASETMDKGGVVGKYNPANLYLKGLERSDAAFSAFMNDLTWDTFLKFSEAAPNDPAFLRDSVHNLGVIYGRGTGPIAEAIGKSKLGDVFYAPRYTLSQMQYAGTPIRALNPKAFETTAGRVQALKIYGTQAAAYGTLVALARLAGWDIETDLRSSDFGTIGLPGGRRLDIFGKESQAYRLVANIVAGRVTKKNEYEPPGFVTAAKSLGQFGMGKLAPGPRLPSDALFGSFDPDKGQTPFTMAEFGKRYLPLWVQQTLQNGDLATVPLAILGQDVSKDQKAKLTPEQRAKSHPMELPKIKAKPDPLGRPQDTKAMSQDADVIKEVQRLGIELKWPDKRDTDTDAEFERRAKLQGDAVRDAIRSQMNSNLYGNMTVTEKRESIKAEISRAKEAFNKDFNESERTRKADERLKQIEKELATGRK